LHEAKVLHYEKKFVKYEIVTTEGGPDRVRVEFEGGHFDECDLLVSAEGSVSKVSQLKQQETFIVENFIHLTRSVQVNSQIGLNNIVQLRRKWGFLAKGNLPVEKLQALTPLLQKGAVACSIRGTTFFASGMGCI
jgi:hypothetical protein